MYESSKVMAKLEVDLNNGIRELDPEAMRVNVWTWKGKRKYIAKTLKKKIEKVEKLNRKQFNI